MADGDTDHDDSDGRNNDNSETARITRAHLDQRHDNAGGPDLTD